MMLMVQLLLLGGFLLPIQTFPLTAPDRPPREVPETSYARPPGAAYPAFSSLAPETEVKIIKQTQEMGIDGEFSYSFEADNGISVDVRGSLKSISANEMGQVMEGRYSYTAPDGTLVSVQWTADETGFHANVQTPPTTNSVGK